MNITVWPRTRHSIDHRRKQLTAIVDALCMQKRRLTNAETRSLSVAQRELSHISPRTKGRS